jgi:hypothetical protein
MLAYELVFIQLEVVWLLGGQYIMRDSGETPWAFLLLYISKSPALNRAFIIKVDGI